MFVIKELTIKAVQAALSEVTLEIKKGLIICVGKAFASLDEFHCRVSVILVQPFRLQRTRLICGAADRGTAEPAESTEPKELAVLLQLPLANVIK